MTTEGPFLYDDGPAPLHTGTPRRSGRILVLIFGATAAFAVLMVVLMVVVKGTPAEQAREVTGVFLAALAQNDTETAYGLLCEKEAGRLAPEQVAGAYLGDGAGTVGTVREQGDEQLVTVAWARGGSSELAVIAEKGPKICGVAAG